jgi:hypothetical protein
LTGFFGEVVVAWLVVVTGVVLWLVIVVWVVDVVVPDFFGEVAVVVVCVGAVDVVWVAAVWVLAILWVLDEAWVTRAVGGLGLAVVVVVVAIGADAICCFVELVLAPPLPPHAARLSMSTTTLRAAIALRAPSTEERRQNDLLSIRADM